MLSHITAFQLPLALMMNSGGVAIVLLQLTLVHITSGVKANTSAFLQGEYCKDSIAMHTPARFPGGLDSLRQQVHANVKYPSTCLKKHIGGEVVLQLEIDSVGQLLYCAVYVSSNNALLDAEAIRATMTLNKILWEPRKNNHISRPDSVLFALEFDPENYR
jgi:TonB family protein